MLSSAIVIQGLPSASFHFRHQIGRHQLKMEAYSTMFCNSSAREWFHQKSKKGITHTSTRKCLLTLTEEFSGELPAQKSAGRVKDSSKLSSTLQHLLTTSERDIGSEVNLVGSFTPSYLKARCFRYCKGCIRRLTKENTT